jgi:hypothetical protein
MRVFPLPPTHVRSASKPFFIAIAIVDAAFPVLAFHPACLEATGN